MTLATTYDQEWLQTYQTADGEIFQLERHGSLQRESVLGYL